MDYFQLKTPVAFLVFNRPDTSIKVFEEIRRVRPPKLFVVADGPRTNKPGELEKCLAVRAIIDTVDWPCEVLKNYSDVNLGCKTRVSSGIDWVFSQVEQAIILEDDCLPHLTFFQFCEELLEKYNNDQRVMHIGGSNFQDGKVHGDGSYYFSRFSHIWGWATWRRAWSHYDVKMKDFPIFRDQNQIQNIFPEKSMHAEWINKLQTVYDGELDTWDLQWLYTVWSKNGLAIIPNANVVSNIGFGENATHTTMESELANKELFSIDKIIHPSFELPCTIADNYTVKSHFSARLSKRILGKVNRIIKRVIA